jgi:PAS domain S-box-containing protein
VQTGEPVRFENQSIALNRWFDVNAFPIGEPHSKQFAVLFTNTTERKQIEQALCDSEEQSRNILESISDAFFALDDNWLFTYMNGAAATLLDRTPGDLIGKNIWAEYPGLLGSNFEPLYKGSAQRRVADTLTAFYPDHDRWYEVRTYPAATGMSVYFRNVTDLKQAEEALRESEERFRNMADNAPMMVWVTDPTGYCTYLSRSWYEFSGQSESDGLGFGWLGATHPNDREFARNIFLGANERHESFQLEYRLLRQDGEYRTCIDVGCPWFDADGEFRGFIGSVIDIDERKQMETTLAERARELANLNTLLAQAATLLDDRNQELDRFVHVVAHDLKAPLRAIANLSEWIEEDLEGSLTPDTQQQMNRLRGRVRLMESTISGLLDYARAGRTDATVETVSVDRLLAETIDSLAPPPTFEMTIEPGMPTLHTQRLLLSQVFANLIGNAFKHHDRLDGSIRISSRQQGDFYEFAIADDGPGIAPADRERVFVIFQAANPQKNPDSSGIGLAIVKKIVETAGGTIRLESELGRGTTFYFTWPNRS